MRARKFVRFGGTGIGGGDPGARTGGDGALRGAAGERLAPAGPAARGSGGGTCLPLGSDPATGNPSPGGWSADDLSVGTLPVAPSSLANGFGCPLDAPLRGDCGCFGSDSDMTRRGAGPLRTLQRRHRMVRPRLRHVQMSTLPNTSFPSTSPIDGLRGHGVAVLPVPPEPAGARLRVLAPALLSRKSRAGCRFRRAPFVCWSRRPVGRPNHREP